MDTDEHGYGIHGSARPHASWAFIRVHHCSFLVQENSSTEGGPNDEGGSAAVTFARPSHYFTLAKEMIANSEPVSLDFGLLALRVTAGGTVLWQHGWPKLAHFTDKMDHFGDPLGLGPTFSLGLIVFAETVCAVLVMLGLWTRLSTVPLIIGMGVAAFVANGAQPFADKELAVCYMAAFTAIFFAGSGRFSLDRLSFK